jgi:hypothetical protein
MAMASMSAPAQQLGLGGGDLQQQVKDETEEEKKRRLQLAQQRQALGPAGMSLGLGGY